MALPSFRRRLILSFVGLAVVPLLIAATVVGWQTFHQSLEDSYSRQQELAQRVSIQVKSLSQRIETILIATLNASDFENLDRPKQREILNNILSQGHLFQEATFINPDGELLIRQSNVRITDINIPLSNIEQRVFEEALYSAKINYGTVYFDKRNNEPLITVGVPIIDPRSGKVVGIVGMTLRFKAIWDLVSAIELLQGESIYIIDIHGQVVAHPNRSLVLRGSNISIRKDQRQQGLEQNDVVMAQHQIVLGSRVFSVVVERAEQMALDRALEQLWNLLLIAAVTFAVALLLFVMVSRYLLRPVTAISRAASAIREGNWQYKVPVEQQDEMGEMAAAFNSMTQRLIETLNKLEEENLQRARAEANLIRANERLETLTQFETDWVYWRNEDRDSFYYMSPTCESFTGYSIDEFQQDAGLLDRLIHPDDLKLWHSHSHKRDSSGNLMPDEFRIVKKSGEIRWMSHTCQQVFTENGKRDGRRGSNQDITERKEVEIEKYRLQKELQQVRKMEAIGQLTGGIAHDFNNILGIIIGNTSLCMNRYQGEIPEKMTQHLETVLKASDRAKDLVVQMLTFSRSGDVTAQPLQLTSLVKENVKMLGSILPSSIKIVVNCEDKLPSVMMDPVQLQQLVMNLCINAKDAMNGTGNLTIDLGWRRGVDDFCSACHKKIDGDWIELSVTDTGIGMTSETLEHLFEPFYTTKDVGKGTGLGMAVLHGIISSNKGHALVETELGKGTTIHLLFPPIVEEKQTTHRETAPSENILPSGTGRHLLVVDDEPDLAEYIAVLLELYDYQVTKQTDSLKALSLFREEPDKFDLVITDQTMPELTGVELVKKLREIRAELPAILCTGYSEGIDADDAENMAIRYLGKPIDADRLVQSVGELLGSIK